MMQYPVLFDGWDYSLFAVAIGLAVVGNPLIICPSTRRLKPPGSTLARCFAAWCTGQAFVVVLYLLLSALSEATRQHRVEVSVLGTLYAMGVGDKRFLWVILSLAAIGNWTIVGVMLRLRLTMVLGVFLLCLPLNMVAGGLSIIPSMRELREEARLATCRARLRTVGLALLHYASENVGVFPPNLNLLEKDPSYRDAMDGLRYDPASDGPRRFKYFYCAAVVQETVPAASARLLAADDDNARNHLIACDYSDKHRQRRCVLFGDGSVESVRESRFQQYLHAERNALFAQALLANERNTSAPSAAQPGNYQAADRASSRLDEQRLARDLEGSASSLSVSHDGTHFALVVRRGDKSRVLSDGREGPAYDEIGRLHHTGTGMLLYAARQGEKWRIVMNGQANLAYDMIGPPVVSPDDAHWACLARKGNSLVMVIDGREGPECESLSFFKRQGDSYSSVAKNGQSSQLFVRAENDSPEFSRASTLWYMAQQKGEHSLFFFDDRGLRARLAIPLSSLWYFAKVPRHIAYTEKTESKIAAIVDAQVEGNYDRVGKILFSDDGEHWAYGVVNANHAFVVIDGRPGPTFDATQFKIEAARFSPDGSRLACAAETANGQSVIVGTDVGPSYAEIDFETLTFSADGRRLAYTASTGERRMAIVDGKPIGGYDASHRIRRFFFSPDGRYFAYDVLRQGSNPMTDPDTAFVVVDGISDPKAVFLEVSDVRVLDGRQSVYRAISRETGKKCVVIHDSQRAVPLVGLLSEPTVSPNLTRVACVLGKGKGACVSLNGQDQEVYKRIIEPVVFSPDGLRLGYSAQKENNRHVVIVDGKEGPEYEHTSSLKFSSDGKHHMYVASTNGTECLVVDGQEGPSFDQLRLFEVPWTPDGKPIYTGRKDGKWCIIYNGRLGPEFDRIGDEGPQPPAVKFSSDGKHWMCVAKRADDWHVILDGWDGPAYEEIHAYWLCKDGTARYLASKNRFLYLVSPGGKGR